MAIREHVVSYRNGPQIMVAGLKLKGLGYCRGAHVQVTDPSGNAASTPSIRSLGPAFYPPNVVQDWQEGLAGDVYLKALGGGEVFFIATRKIENKPVVLGFASDYPIEGTTHGTSVYVRGIAARRGIGSALLGLAEAHAISRGATHIQVRRLLPVSSSTRRMGSSKSVEGRLT